MNELDDSIRPMLARYASAVRDRDAAAFMRLYDPKVRVYDAWGVWSYEDAAGWQRAVEGWFASLGSERVKVSFDEVSIMGSPQMALVSAIVTYAGESAEGVPLRAMQNRLTWGLRTSGHVLRIVHEHTSAPIGFEDQKAILHKGADG